jgi:hypothetical protein
MIQSLSLFWPLILLAAVGIAAFVGILVSTQRRRGRQPVSDPNAGPLLRPRSGNSAVVRPGSAVVR